MKKLRSFNQLFAVLMVVSCFAASASAQAKKPNILVIWGDDIGITNISAYSRGLMGYKTPNIDRIANEGALFTDYYAEQSCTAGRAGFITGQIPFRTGLTKVGLPGAKQGLSHEDPTIAELLKNHGYATAQFGKNHLGDRNEFLPTVHGFDEYSGVLYHLNALEEPENVDYPKNPEFLKKYGPRNNLYSWATNTFDKTEHPRWGVVGKQKIKDDGALTKKRMETYDQETLEYSLKFIDKAVKDDKPFFVWHNSTRMHVYTHLSKKYQDMVAEKGFYGAGMTEFDDDIGVLLKRLDDLGIADDTIVIISTDNGAEKFSWPDGGTTPFRGEKATTWEGGFRVPCVVRWPGVVKPGTVINDIFSHQDWLPTFLAAVGEPDIKEKLLKGHKAHGKTFKVHIDGYNQLDLLKGKGPGARKEIFYITDDGDFSALRYGKWKIVFLQQKAIGLDVWREALVPVRFPYLIDLRADPFEEASTPGPSGRSASYEYDKWHTQRMFALIPAQAIVAEFLGTFKEYPPRQKPGSFGVGDALSHIQTASQGR
ncbi:MAG: arylsulfatase [Planctomycetota bacterium]|jgi:arylsulfatase